MTDPPLAPSVRVTADRRDVAAGEALRVTVTVANPGDAPLPLELASACATDFELVDARGAVVATADRMCAQLLTTRTVAPGAAFRETHAVPRGAAHEPTLAPGRYTLRGVLLLASGAVRSPAIDVTLG